LLPAEVVRKFLECLEVRDVDAAMELLSPDVVYQNVSLPTLRGRERVRRAFRWLANGRTGFEVTFHTVAAEGGSVLTERTDVLLIGPLRMQIWVCGRFDVRDGQIELWRDYFDFWNATLALARGLLALVIPAFAPPTPAESPQE
jgi:limonene-1,2-epoxide hydrolase